MIVTLAAAALALTVTSVATEARAPVTSCLLLLAAAGAALTAVVLGLHP